MNAAVAKAPLSGRQDHAPVQLRPNMSQEKAKIADYTGVGPLDAGLCQRPVYFEGARVFSRCCWQTIQRFAVG
jgi:hypothetical protein